MSTPAGGDFRLVVSFRAGRFDLPLVRLAFQLIQRLVGPVFGRVQIDPARAQALGENGLQGGSCRSDIPGLGVAKRGASFAIRRQVDLNRTLGLPIRGNLQDGRPTQAAMRDQHLFPEGLPAGGGDDVRGNSRQVAVFGAILLPEYQRD